MSLDQLSVLPSDLNNLTDIVLLDVREKFETDNGVIPGAVCIPLGELEQSHESKLDKDKVIVVYCEHGIRSLEAAFFLKSSGYEKVHSLEGGYVAWMETKN